MAKTYNGELVVIGLIASIFWASMFNLAIPMLLEDFVNLVRNQ